MNPEDAPELKKPVPIVSVLFVGLLIAAGYFLGHAHAKIEAQDKSHAREMEGIKENMKNQHAFAIDEVGGLRNDMVRELEHIERKFQEVEKKINKIEAR